MANLLVVWWRQSVTRRHGGAKPRPPEWRRKSRQKGGPDHEVRGVYYRGEFRRRGDRRRADDRQPEAADRPGRGARLRGDVARGAPLRPLRNRRPAEPDSARRGPGGADVQDSHRADGEHRAVVASHTARRRPRDPGQHDRRARGGRLRQGYLAVRRAAVPPQRGPAQGRREPGAVQGDGRGGAGDMDQRVLFVSRVQLQLPRRRHRVFAPQVPVQPRLAGRGPGDEAEGDAETPPEAAPAAVDDGLHGPVGDDGGGDGAEGVLLAAAGSQDQAANGTVRADQNRAGGEAVRAWERTRR